MSSNLRVNNILPSVGTNVAIGTAGGSITLTGGVTGSNLTLTGGINATGVLTATTFSGNLTGNVTGNVTGTVSSSGIATFSNGIVVAAGTTAAPSISPSGDSNTGIFFPAADTVAIGEGGVEALRIDSNGRVGINSSIPAYPLDVRGTARISSYLTMNSWINGTTDLDLYGDVSSSNGLKIKQAGNVEITNGNLVFSTAGKGIDFSATANSSGTMTSELLSDYEEGTWTPTIASASSNVTYTNQSGQYTKIGRLVDFAFQININTVTSVGSGDFTIGGLPFTQGTNNGRYVIQTSDLDFDSTKYSHYAYPDGSTGLKVLYTADNAGWTVASATSFPVKAGSIITARGSYIV